jgi:hypothetical protein
MGQEALVVFFDTSRTIPFPVDKGQWTFSMEGNKDCRQRLNSPVKTDEFWRKLSLPFQDWNSLPVTFQTPPLPNVNLHFTESRRNAH